MSTQFLGIEISIKRDRLIKNAIIILLLILILAVEGCFSFVEFGFNWEKLSPSNIGFWSDIILRLVLLLIVRTLAIFVFKERTEMHSQTLFVEKTKNAELMKFKRPNFSEYIDTVANREIKIRFWKEECTQRLTKLNKKASDTDRILFCSKNEADIEAKKLNRYCSRRTQLETFMTDEWIEENIDSMNVKCPKLNPNVFDISVSKTTKFDEFNIEGRQGNAMLSILISASILMLGFNIIKQALEYNKTDANVLAIFISLGIDMALMSLQFIWGWNDSINIVNNEVLVPYTNRNRYLINYLYWNNADKIDSVKNNIAQIDSMVESERKLKFEGKKEA